MEENSKPLCPCCMCRHDVRVIRRREANVWKGRCVLYEAEYYWCTRADAYFADERMITKNHRAMLRAVVEAKTTMALPHSEFQLKEMIPMSYDISLKDPVTKETITIDEPHFMAGGTYQVGGTKELWLNITYNYGQFYRRDDVLGPEGIRAIYGMTGAQSIPILEKAAAALGDDVNTDYWEATEGNAKKPLLQLLAMARMRPDGVWDGD